MKTYSTKASDIERQWHVLDASDKILGKLATEAAKLLMGKHKPIFTRHLDTGVSSLLSTPRRSALPARKRSRSSITAIPDTPGGLKTINLERLMATNPTRVIEHAVKGMLPHNRLGAKMLKKLKVYAGEEHPHLAQTGASSKGD